MHRIVVAIVSMTSPVLVLLLLQLVLILMVLVEALSQSTICSARQADIHWDKVSESLLTPKFALLSHPMLRMLLSRLATGLPRNDLLLEGT